jgi:hypothetical protein
VEENIMIKNQNLWLLLLLLLAACIVPASVLANPPGITELNGAKVLTLVGRDPPGVRCNTNIQVAAELANSYKIPVLLVPQGLAGPGTKAPAVYYGAELVAVDGGNLNGMLDATSLADVLELGGAQPHEKKGRLVKIQSDLEALKAAIKKPN